jgi:hypothetical protein
LYPYLLDLSLAAVAAAAAAGAFYRKALMWVE